MLLSTGCAASAVAPPASPAAAIAAGAMPAAPSPIGADADPDDLVHVDEEVMIDAPIERIWAVFDDPRAYATILPLVRSIEPRGKDAKGALILGLTQGVSIASGSYTARIVKVRPHELELAIDHDFPSILRDGRGRVELTSEPGGQTRVTYSMTVDLGDHWILHLFKDRIRKALTQPPYLLKGYVEGQLTPPRK
jgi:carbon monoxide dehydrogenase subunit G